MPKRLPNIIFAFSIMHGSCSGKIISAVDIVAVGDYPDCLIIAMTRDSLGW